LARRALRPPLPDERQPFKERWLGRCIAYDIENFFVDRGLPI